LSSPVGHIRQSISIEWGIVMDEQSGRTMYGLSGGAVTEHDFIFSWRRRRSGPVVTLLTQYNRSWDRFGMGDVEPSSSNIILPSQSYLFVYSWLIGQRYKYIASLAQVECNSTPWSLGLLGGTSHSRLQLLPPHITASLEMQAYRWMQPPLTREG